ncbi:MAG: hypothetical protein AAF394_13640 [Planctomycetota bacterium]
MEHRYEVTCIEGLVQQLVVHLKNGYWFYVAGEVPKGKSPLAIDSKLIARYDAGLSKYQKARRRAKGCYNIQYLRFERHWFLLATHGKHPRDEPGAPHPEGFFRREARNFRDTRRSPIRTHSYSISTKRARDRKYHVLVRIEQQAYKEQRDYLTQMATRRSFGWCVNQIWNMPFQPYTPVRRQYMAIVRKMNAARKTAGFKEIPLKFIPYRRKIVKPFDEQVCP